VSERERKGRVLPLLSSSEVCSDCSSPSTLKHEPRDIIQAQKKKDREEGSDYAMEMAARLGLEVWRGIKLKTLSEGYAAPTRETPMARGRSTQPPR